VAVLPLTASAQIVKLVRGRPAEPGRTGSEVTRHQDPPNPPGESDQIPNLPVRHSLRAAGQRLDRPQPSSGKNAGGQHPGRGHPSDWTLATVPRNLRGHDERL